MSTTPVNNRDALAFQWPLAADNWAVVQDLATGGTILSDALDSLTDPAIRASTLGAALQTEGAVKTITVADGNLTKNISGNTIDLGLADDVIVKTVKATIKNNDAAPSIAITSGDTGFASAPSINSNSGLPAFEFTHLVGGADKTGAVVYTLTLANGVSLSDAYAGLGNCQAINSTTGVTLVNGVVARASSSTITITIPSATYLANITYRFSCLFFPTTL